MKKLPYLLILFAILIVGFASGYVIGNGWGYHDGIKDGMQSTLLINVDDECEVIHYE